MADTTDRRHAGATVLVTACLPLPLRGHQSA